MYILVAYAFCLATARYSTICNKCLIDDFVLLEERHFLEGGTNQYSFSKVRHLFRSNELIW